MREYVISKQTIKLAFADHQTCSQLTLYALSRWVRFDQIQSMKWLKSMNWNNYNILLKWILKREKGPVLWGDIQINPEKEVKYTKRYIKLMIIKECIHNKQK